MPRKNQGFKRFNFYLDPKDVGALERLAKRKGQSTSETLRLILKTLRLREEALAKEREAQEKRASLDVVEGGQ